MLYIINSYYYKLYSAGLKSYRVIINIASLILLIQPITTYSASLESNEEFARHLSLDAAKMHLEFSREAVADLDLLTGKESLGVGVQRSALMVFVSTSMSLALLKEYYVEASKFGATLVFRGLPDGSFQELSKIVMLLEEHTYPHREKTKEEGDANLVGASIVIDDESFKKFSVTSVPTTILLKYEDCQSLISCGVTYDKVSGNIGIHGALEEFIKGGALQRNAESILSAIARGRK